MAGKYHLFRHAPNIAATGAYDMAYRSAAFSGSIHLGVVSQDDRIYIKK
jgi:hypothetical protein